MTHGSGSCGCGKLTDQHKHSINEIVQDVYKLHGQNFLSPKNEAIAKGFWSAGQPKGKKGKEKEEDDD